MGETDAGRTLVGSGEAADVAGVTEFGLTGPTAAVLIGSELIALEAGALVVTAVGDVAVSCVTGAWGAVATVAAAGDAGSGADCMAVFTGIASVAGASIGDCAAVTAGADSAPLAGAAEVAGVSAGLSAIAEGLESLVELVFSASAAGGVAGGLSDAETIVSGTPERGGAAAVSAVPTTCRRLGCRPVGIANVATDPPSSALTSGVSRLSAWFVATVSTVGRASLTMKTSSAKAFAATKVRRAVLQTNDDQIRLDMVQSSRIDAKPRATYKHCTATFFSQPKAHMI